METGPVTLIYQSEFIEWLKSKRYSYISIENWIKQARIMARKRLLQLSESELETELWENYSRAMKKTFLYVYRKYWSFRENMVKA
ncbi:hypothetical protein HNP93_000974 [Methanococcus maripaludis]|uniref:Uncharacterized protein n=1 Tax=Methanococcus maripaludis TaxID=39152 RepID=A0A7J9P4Z6_METMI|nr:hypothetical protein [Methanococcus maripaludis]MBA2858273.1 hypothetical protein [Methanococcus maripaludis]